MLTVSAMLLGLLAGLLAATSAFAQEVSVQGDVNDTPDEVYALTTDDQLLFFDGADPRDTESAPITGLEEGESLIGIDFRPVNGQLYGVGDQSNVYTIEEDTTSADFAVATQISTLEDSDGDVVELVGKYFGVDFNPNQDRLRIVSDADQNVRVDNVETGLSEVEGELFYPDGDENEGEDPGVTGAAYTNNTNITTSTEQFDIDTSLDLLAQQEPVSGGRLNTVGNLGVDAKGITGFDIVTTLSGSTIVNRAYAALQQKGKKASNFYGVDLETGELTRIGRIGGKTTKIDGLAIPIGQE